MGDAQRLRELGGFGLRIWEFKFKRLRLLGAWRCKGQGL